MKIYVDLDGTLCEQTSGGEEYKNAKPKIDIIKNINRFYNSGCEIYVYSSRGMRSLNGDVNKVNEIYYQITFDWLMRNNVKFTKLILGKPEYDLWIDDKCLNVDDISSFWKPLDNARNNI